MTGVGRWEPDARGRLQKAALELYTERGFDQTTVAEIAERAGLTERTFFRYFADKREVLFAGSNVLQETLVAALAETPESTPPIDQVVAALDSAGACSPTASTHAGVRPSSPRSPNCASESSSSSPR